MLKIVTIPNPVLTQPTKKVEQFDVSLAKLVKDMDQTLTAQVNPQGVGLAATQVGVNLSVFISKPTSKAKTEVFVNPRIIKTQTVEDRRLKIDIEDRKSKIEKNDLSSNLNPQNPSSNIHHQSSKKKKTKLEGCLSIPKIWGSVKRADKVFIEFQDLAGITHKKWFSGFRALIIQHEVDHLKGVLFTQRALEQNSQLFEEKEGKLEKFKY